LWEAQKSRDNALHQELLWRQKGLDQGTRNAELEGKVLSITDQWKASREELARERTETEKLRTRVTEQDAQIEELRRQNLAERSFAEQEDPSLTSAREFLDRLGYQEAPRGYAWVPKDSPVSSPEPPLTAEESLVRNLIRQLPR
jgi:hypothetical protein